jgi:outer membrane protein OmpA-like peptidoglycan-associated protein
MNFHIFAIFHHHLSLFAAGERQERLFNYQSLNHETTDRRHPMKKICAMLLSASILNSSMAAAEQDTPATTSKEAAGFGLGAILGGLIGGPPGAVIGAAGGTIFGNHAAKKDDAIAALEKQLQEKSLALATLQNELEAARYQYAGNLQQVATENKLQSFKKLGDGMSFPVYFRTNDAGITPEVGQQIQKLATLVRDYPEIKVHLDAYADERGLPSYNLQLSKARALTVQKELTRAGLPSNRIFQYAHGEELVDDGCGDVDAYIFDRRVDVQFTLDAET